MGIRPDGSSQGGHTIFIGTEDEMNAGKPFALTIISWHSRKLNRMCRSSLSAEAQSVASAIDEVESTKIFTAGMVCPDSARSVSADLRLTEKRTEIEVAIVKERLAAILERNEVDELGTKSYRWAHETRRKHVEESNTDGNPYIGNTRCRGNRC